MDFSNQNIAIYTCQFQAFVQKAKVQIKFPCNYFLQWKANNGKVIISSANRYTANKSQILFNQSLQINVNILYDRINKKYLKKESLLMINLISKSRPDQIKLVGRVVVDLADVLNCNSFGQLTTAQLEYCSVEATVNFSIRSISVKQSTMHVSQLDRSSFNEYMSFQANFKPQLVHRNEGSSTHRDFDQVGSAKGSQQKEIRSLGRDKNKMSSSSLSKQAFTPTNKSQSRIIQSAIIQQKMNRSNSIPNQMDKPTSKVNSPQSQVPVTENENNFSFHKNNQEEQSGKVYSSHDFMGGYGKVRGNIVGIEGKGNGVAGQGKGLGGGNGLQLNMEAISKEGSMLTTFKEQSPGMVGRVSHNIGGSAYESISNNANTSNNINTARSNILSNNTPSTLTNPNLPLPTSPHNNNDQSFTSTTKQPNIKRLSLQLSKSNQQSRRILGLTSALNQLEQKYTKLTLQNEQMRASYKREKEELLVNMGRVESMVAVRDSEIREKGQVIQLLKESNRQLELTCNDRLAQMIYLKSQLSQSTTLSTTLQHQNTTLHHNITTLTQQLTHLHSQSSLTTTQLNQSFAQRLSIYQQNSTNLQLKLKEQQFVVREMKERNHLLQEQVRRLDEENRHYLTQIESAHSELFAMREEVEGLRGEVKIREAVVMEGVGKDDKVEEMYKVLKEKDEQLLSIREQLQTTNNKLTTQNQHLQTQNQHLTQQNQHLTQQNKTLNLQLTNLTQSTTNQLNHYITNQHQYTTKINQLQNTILRLSDQQQSELSSKLTQSQNTLLSLNQQLNHYQQQINSYKQTISILQQHKKSTISQQLNKQTQHQQVILNLNNQLQQHKTRNLQLQQLITTLNQQITQLTIKLTQQHHSHQLYIQQTTQQLSSLELMKTQLTLYQQKFNQQQYLNHQQLQSIKLSYTQQQYQLEITLQDLSQKYNQLQQINNLLKASIEEWQTKWTEDRLTNTKMVQRLNQIIVEKEGVMRQMEAMMRQLQMEKEGLGQVATLLQQKHLDMKNSYRTKTIQMKQLAQDQQLQLALLYNQVKTYRTTTTTTIHQHQLTIQNMTTEAHHLQSTITQLTTATQALSVQLADKQVELEQAGVQFKEELQRVRNEHNVEVDEYEERIRELESVLGQRDGELLEKELMVCDLQREKQGLFAQIQEKNQLIVKAQLQKHQSQNNYTQSLTTLHLKQHQLSHLSQQLHTLKQSLIQHQSKYTQLQTSFIQCQQSQSSKVTSLEQEKALLEQQVGQLSGRIGELTEVIRSKQQQLIQLAQQNEHQLIKKEEQFSIRLSAVIQQQQQLKQQQLSTLTHYQSSLRQQLQSRLSILQQQITSSNQLILQKTTTIQSLQHQKQQLMTQLQSIKSERETVMLLNYKEQGERYKRKVQEAEQELIRVRGEVAKIPSLERTVKIKTIQLNSFKYKAGTGNSGNSGNGNNHNSSGNNHNNPNPSPNPPTPTTQHQQIIRLQAQQIQQLKSTSTKLTSLQLQTYQLQATNLQLNQAIQQYQQQKFLLHSQLNQCQIQLQQHLNLIQNLTTHKQQLKDKLNEMTQKLNHYEGLIMDFRGHDMSTTKSQSDKINGTRGSSNRVVNDDAQDDLKGDIAHKLQLDTFVKKIKMLEGDVKRNSLREEELIKKENQYVEQIQLMKEKIAQLQNTIAAKQSQQSKRPTTHPTTQPPTPPTRLKGQIIRNPQQITQSSKQLQSLLKKRNQFYNLESLLTKISTMKDNHSESMTKDKEEDQKIKDKISSLTGNVSSLLKEFQNVKTRIMKLEGKNYQQKAKIISLIRPFEEKILETVKLSSGQVKIQAN